MVVLQRADQPDLTPGKRRANSLSMSLESFDTHIVSTQFALALELWLMLRQLPVSRQGFDVHAHALTDVPFAWLLQ